jgi:hypothetical protein
MEIWDYDRRTGVLIGRSFADPCPIEKGAWHIPAFATTKRPPIVPPGCIAVFDGGLSAVGDWRIEMSVHCAVAVGTEEHPRPAN